MTKTRFIKSHRWLLVVLLLAVIVTGGIFMFSLHEKSKEERRNREYEVSLVKALKNSYEGIEEIKITNPNYVDKPGSWSCDVAIKFKDGKEILYGINHHLNDEINYGGRQKTDEDWEYLEYHKGKTPNEVKVSYSDGNKGVG